MSGQEKEPQTGETQQQATYQVPRTKTPDRLTILKLAGLRPSGLPRRDAGIPPTTFPQAGEDGERSIGTSPTPIEEPR